MNPLVLLGDLAPVDLRSVTVEADRANAPTCVLANLETPLCSPTLLASAKAGPTLRADPRILTPIQAAFPKLVVSLANNHMMDFGPEGLAATQRACAEAGIQMFGAGADATAATRPLRVSAGSRELTLIAACDRQFGCATATHAGVAPFGPDLPSRVMELRRDADLLVVSVHGASEMSPWPSPRWQQALRALIDAGADLVHGHHAHVPQGFEQRGKGWIVYGAGNTLVNPAIWSNHPASLLSWRYEFDMDDFSQAPHVSTWEVGMAGESAAHIRKHPAHEEARIRACNEPLHDARLLSALWQQNAMLLWDTFYREGLAWKPSFGREIRHLLGRGRRGISEVLLHRPALSDQAVPERFLYHLFACEHHAEAIATALGLLCGAEPDLRCTASRELAEKWLNS